MKSARLLWLLCVILGCLLLQQRQRLADGLRASESASREAASVRQRVSDGEAEHRSLLEESADLHAEILRGYAIPGLRPAAEPPPPSADSRRDPMDVRHRALLAETRDRNAFFETLRSPIPEEERSRLLALLQHHLSLLEKIQPLPDPALPPGQLREQAVLLGALRHSEERLAPALQSLRAQVLRSWTERTDAPLEPESLALLRDFRHEDHSSEEFRRSPVSPLPPLSSRTPETSP